MELGAEWRGAVRVPGLRVLDRRRLTRHPSSVQLDTTSGPKSERGTPPRGQRSLVLGLSKALKMT